MADTLTEVPEGPFDSGYKGPDWDDESWDREPDPPDPTPPMGPTDGITLYRALARQHIGDPCKEKAILNAVLEHFIRVLLNEKHGLHQCYLNFNKARCKIRAQEYTFFGLLACPDFGLCPCVKNRSLTDDGNNNENVQQPHEDPGPILFVIANALNVRIALWDSKCLLGECGPVTVPTYHVKFRVDGQRKCLHRCSALVEVDDGAALVDYLFQQRGKKNALQIKRMSWWPIKQALQDSEQFYFKEEEMFNEFECFNENLTYRAAPPDLRGNLNSLTVFTVSVNRPAQIEPALKLLDEALERAPSQNVPMLQRSSGHYLSLKPYFTVDAEFWEVDRNGKLREPNGRSFSSQGEGSPPRRSQRLGRLRRNLGLNSEDEGEAESKPELEPPVYVDNRTLPTQVAEKENICTVLTIAVDRHLVFSFFILDMLQKADSDPTTVPELTELFKRTIFNQRYSKIWFNYQQDIRVIDTTIAHMYQGTKRHNYIFHSHLGVEEHPVSPRWMLHATAFNGSRPEAVTFSKDAAHECDLHAFGGLRACDRCPENVSDEGLFCPCQTTCNFDVATIVCHVCRQLGGVTSELGIAKVDWNTVVHGTGYAQFLNHLLFQDRLCGLLAYLKNAPFRHVDRSTQALSDRLDTLVNQAEKKLVGGGRVSEVEEAEMAALEDQLKGDRTYAKESFYKDLGPGMETYDDAMGYNIGDVVGIALFMRFLLTTDDRKLLVNRLIRFDAMRGYREQQKQRRKPICRSSARRLHPLIEDYPKMYHKQEIKDMGMYGNIASYFKGRSDYGTREHSYYEHDNRAAVGSEEYIKSNPSPSKKRKAEEQKRREDARKEAEERLFDPLDFELPQMFLMGSDVWNPLDYPRSTVVRAGASHREDLFATVYEVARKQGRDQVEFPAAFMERIDASKDPYLAEDIFPGSSLGGLKQKPSDTFSFGPKDALYGTEGPTVHSKTRGKSFRPVGGISSTNVNKKQPTKAIAGSSATASLPAKGKASAPKRPLGIATRDEDIWDHEGTEYENNLELGPLWNCFARYEGDDIAPSKRCAEHDVGTSPTRKLPRRTRGD